MLSQPELEIPDIPIIVDAAAVLHEPLAKRPDLPTLLQDLRDVVVFIWQRPFSAPEIDQHLAAGSERLLDFLLGARLVEDYSGVCRIADRGSHPRPQDRDDDLGVRRLQTLIY